MKTSDLLPEAVYSDNQTITSAGKTTSGASLPSSYVISNRDISSISDRNVIHVFLPNVGVFKFYINPSDIVYSFPKVITPTATKGGYSINYWGENLGTLNINGNTGSSAVEGINALNEAYRSEQYAIDKTGLLLSQQNYTNIADVTAKNIIDSSASILGGDNSSIQNILGLGSSLLGANSNTQISQIPDPPSLAESAFGVEIYYSGWVFRGYFTSFSFTERNDNFLYTYNLGFSITQRRGYRYNYLPWHKSPNGEPGNSPYSFEDDGSYQRDIIPNRKQIVSTPSTVRTITQLQRNVTGR